ncbi:chromosome segregation protein [Rhodobium orientis]|uniref:Chromosome partition protein Smc n=1 Tax=Rhodobium orientis TaxID=34017 RepID=A0A327JEM5_9HYPH|nr:chromosome segregation protein SMC [Rhodobium orientis]MBB4305643.1 chromosome segregation protein [Rhodobium orientis]MBK5949157.1 chromosome segregation protein SMC [Rhodobium orientis]RAI24789.1 chromosome segregation protein SMC [Rhodobium orientis]
MKFSKLRILGFKSFVEPVEFHFEDGLTGIVGPNGCGKSNLVEALRWVMGESSYKNMRASGMDDVIFSGSHSRPARNTAEVVVVLDNAARRLPATLADTDAVEITRRIEREAGSVYKINGKDARARDVQLLFADASTGARSPALVRQGQVGELIAAKPTQRRAILEEAAGISGLHSRRHEAELRLRGAEQNLERLEDVLVQIDTQHESLKRQARQANRYRNLSHEIRRAEATLLHIRWQAAKSAVAADEAALTEASKEVARRTEVQAGAAKEQAIAAHELTGLRDAEAKSGAALQRLKLSLGELDAEDRRVRDRIADLERRLEQLAGDAEREEKMKAETAEALERLDEELRALAAEDASTGEKADEVDRRVAETEEKLAASEKEQSRVTAEAADIKARRDQLDRTLRDAATRTERLGGQIADVDRELHKIAAELAGDTAIAAATTERDAATAALAEAEELLAAAEARAASAQEAERAARPAVTEAEKTLGRIDVEAGTLKRLLARGTEAKWSPVVEAVSVTSGFERALGAALGEDLDAPADADAPAHWSLVESEGDPGLPEGARPLADVVKAPDVLSRRIAQIGIVEQADGPRLQKSLSPGQRLVSREGDLWRWDGFVAAADAPSAAAERLAQKNRLDELTAERAEAERQQDACRQTLSAREAERRTADNAVKEARGAVSACRQRLDRARDALIRAEKASTERVSRQSALEEARIRLVSSLEEAESARTEATDSRAALPDTAGLEDQLQRLRGEVAERRGAVAEARSERTTLVREAEMRAARRASIGREKQSWQTRADNAGAQEKVLADRRKDAADELEAIRGAPGEIAEKRLTLQAMIGTAEEKRKTDADALALGERRQADADRAAREALDALSGAREARARAEERLNGARQRAKDTEARIEETLQCRASEAAELAELKPGTTPPDPQAVETRLDRLKTERERLGSVNLRAEEEAEAIAEQRDALTAERDDLIEAIRKLRQGILSLNREARERLLAAFETVNGHFKELFTHLFGGGTAELQLVDSDDPLDAGLEIVARPPGKKPQTMTLLSGGEQALTALALIFAVFLTNPAPICVLDEVDAPLDDANVERYCDLLSEMTRRTDTRFVIVTHNPITMARMNRLFGVTMAERGVSQLVSVDLETAERFREAG